MTEEMACREIVELLSDYLDDALPTSLRADVQAHLDGCDGCTRVLDQLRETVRLTGMLTEEQLSDPQRATLLEAFRTHAGHAGG
jgi:anti-sigma factor RsiW